jgi:hypothetical protein
MSLQVVEYEVRQHEYMGKKRRDVSNKIVRSPPARTKIKFNVI